MPGVVRTGLDVLVEGGFALLRGLRVGLLTHAAAVDHLLRPAAALLHEAPGVVLDRLFGPEHGLTAEAQDLQGVAGRRDPLTGLPVISLYGDSVESLRPRSEHLDGLDAVVIDLQDVGARYYTFQATMAYALEAALARGLKVVVLDRPNPLGGEEVEGPMLRPEFASFVGNAPLPTRHGLTIGELATMYHASLKTHNDLVVVRCQGWRREMLFPQTGLPWVLPSPNMPTFDTALVYPGMCLIEGTNFSEGRGTTRPFELVGFPGIDAGRLCHTLDVEELPGVRFRPVWFAPTFQKHAGKTCGGCQLHVTDARAFQPVRTGLAVLAALRREAGVGFAWRTEPYEFVADRLAIDLLFGSDRERSGLEGGVSWQELARAWEGEEEAFRRGRAALLLYE